MGQAANSTTNIGGTVTVVAKQLGPIVSSFEFYRTFTNEDFYDQAMSDL